MTASLLAVLLCSLLTVTHSSAPWQQKASSPKKGSMDDLMYKNLPPTVFSEQGRLLLVEQSVEKASQEATTASIAILVKDVGVVVVSSVQMSPLMEDEQQNNNSTYRPLLMAPPVQHQVGPGLYAVTAGKATDSLLLKDDILDIAADLWSTMEAAAKAAMLARHVADELQRPTQQSSSDRPILASHALVWDDSSIWRIDPTGQFWNCRAAAIGMKRRELEESLVGALAADEMTVDEAIVVAVKCLRDVVPEGRQLQGIVVRRADKSTTLLTPQTLARMAEAATEEEAESGAEATT